MIIGDIKTKSFGNNPKYSIVNQSALKKLLPTMAFSCSVVGSVGYLLGSLGLFYDSYNDKKNKIKPNQEEGVKTLNVNTKLGKLGLNCTKVALTATATAGIACGLGEGIPLMALGEVSNLSSARIIETPVGTGLFGIGMASIFAGMALDNTPVLKMNEFDFMASKNWKEKSHLVVKNMLDTAKEISSSIFEIAKNSYKWDFWKENILKITPTTVVFSEKIDKDGIISLSKELRHNKNYLMHAASFTLALGGLGIILSTALNQKKAQKTGLRVEEGGFLFDNLGITKYGIDKFTTNGKSSGASYAVGGVINAISQVVGIDNKEGRALQWLGIAGVFLGYSIDRGRNLRKTMQNSKQREALTRVVREWKVDLAQVVNKEDLPKLLKEIKAQCVDSNARVTNAEFNGFVEDIEAFTSGKVKTYEDIKAMLSNSKYSKFAASFNPLSGEKDKGYFIKNPNEAKEILKVCTIKMFGSENPSAIIKK